MTKFFLNLMLCCIVSTLLFTGCSGNLMFQTSKAGEQDVPGVTIINRKHGAVGLVNQTIKIDDQIAIRFLNNFELSSVETTAGDDKNQTTDLYLVGFDSLITLPLIGRVNLVGLNKRDAALKLEQLYSEFVVNTIIDVDIVSVSVDVLGEVNRPGKYKLTQKRTHLTDVLAMAGGVADYGNNKTIKIVRGDRTDPEIITVDLTQVESIASPALYLQDDDIIYVAATTPGLFDRKFRPYTPIIAILNIIATTFVIYYRTK